MILKVCKNCDIEYKACEDDLDVCKACNSDTQKKRGKSPPAFPGDPGIRSISRMELGGDLHEEQEND